MLADRRTGQPREVDVAITQQVASHRVIVCVEATSGRRKASVEWVERMVGKHKCLPTSELVLVSEAGFYDPAKALAEAEGVTAIGPEDLAVDDPAYAVVNSVDSVLTKFVGIVPEEVRVAVQTPDGKKLWFKAVPTNMLYTDTGTELDTLYVLVRSMFDAHWQVLAEQLGIAELRGSGEHKFQLLVPDGELLTVRMDGEDFDRPLHVQQTDPPELQRVIALRVDGKMSYEVAEFELKHRRFGRTAVAYGQSTEEDPGLLVITEDESGGRITYRQQHRGEARGVLEPPTK